MPAAVETTAYLVVAEALTNAVKHSAAEPSRSGSVAARPALARVTDDGVGGATPGVGVGLRGMADRVAALRGTLTVHSAPGAGTRLIVEMPCES